MFWSFYRSFLFVSLEFISDAPNGLKGSLVGNALKLFAKSFDMYVDGT